EVLLIARGAERSRTNSLRMRSADGSGGRVRKDEEPRCHRISADHRLPGDRTVGGLPCRLKLPRTVTRGPAIAFNAVARRRIHLTWSSNRPAPVQAGRKRLGVLLD